MKYRWDKKYIYWGVTVFLALAATVLFASSISQFGILLSGFKKFITILQPVIYGFVIAYLLTPIVNFIEKKILFPIYKHCNLEATKRVKKISRGISIFFSLSLTLVLIYGLLYMLIPQLIVSLSSFVSSAPGYLDNFQKWIEKFMENNPTLDQYFIMASEYLVDYLNDLLPQLKDFLSHVYTSLFDIIVILKNVVIGVIISIYIMNSKELFTGQAKKLLYALFKPRRANLYLNSVRFVHKKFSGFIVGKIIDSIIIGIICYIVTTIMKTPYNVLISVIVGVTNIIPFFGPYIGAVPCTLLILLVNPIQAVYFVIFIIILQTFDGNILGPRILSESTDLTSFWIIFAILLMGGLFGILGMFVGVPIFAVIYTAVAHFINSKLHYRKMPLASEEYQRLDHVELERGAEKYGEFIYREEDDFFGKKEKKEEDTQKESDDSDLTQEKEKIEIKNIKNLKKKDKE